MSVPANDWNNRLKEIIAGLAGLVPDIGAVLKLLIQQFWPTSEVDIWQLMAKEITDMVYAIVDAEILKNELAERESEIRGLKDSMEQYLNAGNHEKGSLMSAMLVSSNTLFEELDHSTNDVHFLSITIIHAYEHLALLLERVKHGKEIYEEDNSKVWEAELEEYLKKYQDYFVRKKDKWNKWRNEQIETHYYKENHPFSAPDSYCDIDDKVSSKHWQYFGNEMYDPQILKPGVDMLKQRVFSELNAALVKNVYLRAFELGNFIPGHENDQPVAFQSVGILNLGPFSVASSDEERHYPKDFRTFTGTMSSDPPGKITQVDVRAGNSIDGSQMHYRGHNGSFVGNPSGGSPHTFKIADEAVVNFVHMGFAAGVLAAVQYKASDKTDSGRLGNASGWEMRYNVDVETSELLDENFVLQGINMQAGTGPDRGDGVANVLLTYYHKSLIK